MREVAIHLEDQLGVARERAAEAGEVRRPEPLLAVAVEDVDERELRRERIGELAGPVGRGVVDHEHAVAVAHDGLERPEHRLEVLALVIGWKTDGCPQGAAV